MPDIGPIAALLTEDIQSGGAAKYLRERKAMPDLTEEMRKVSAQLADDYAYQIAVRCDMQDQTLAWLRKGMRQRYESPAPGHTLLRFLKSLGTKLSRLW